MNVVLEIKSGALVGNTISITDGQTLTFGRAADRSDCHIPDDFMSGVHFAIECSATGCRVVDRKSSNGTFLNEARITEALVANGDLVRGGQTTFVVRFQAQPVSAAPPAPAASSPAPPAHAAAPPPPAPPSIVGPMPATPVLRRTRPPAFSVGSWSFGALPKGWELTEGFGAQYAGKDAFPSSLVATEEQLFEGVTLQQYVEAQITMLRQYLRNPQIEAALPPAIPGSQETVALDVHYATREGTAIFYRRIYARSGPVVGVLTLTTLENELGRVRPAFDELVSDAALEPKPAAQPTAPVA